MYTNKQIFNDGIRFQGQVPADDRTYIDSLSDLYITPATQTSSNLYGRAYKGLVVVVGTSDGSDANVLVCKKATPYNPGSTESVSATNYLTYWRDITDKTKMVNTDRGIKVIQDKFTGTLWKINKIDNPITGVFASYALAAMAPDGNSYVNVPGSAQIDIPELEVVDDVHVCKATYDSATKKYTETARQGDPNWDTAAGDVYLHIVWNTKDDDSDPTDDKSSETYIKVSDMISVDVTDLQRQIDDVSTRLNDQITKERNDVTALNKRIADVSIDVNRLAGYVNTTISENVSTLQANINNVSSNLYNTSTSLNETISDLSVNLNETISDLSVNLNDKIYDATYFDGGSDPDSRYTITATGNLPSGTTIGQLEAMTFSEILKRILFEFCTPHKISNASFSASLSGNYASSKAVEVGAAYPTSANFSTSYTPEKWQWVSTADPTIKGPVASLSNQGTIKYYYNSTNSTTGGTELPSALVAKEGINGYFYAEQAQTAGTHPVDSAGSAVDSNGNYYADTRTDTLKSTTLTFQAGWRVYSNATKTYTSIDTAWNAKNTNPGPYAGSDTKNPTTDLILFNTTHTYYFQWPGNTEDNQLFYIYCPQTYKIDRIHGANNNIKIYDIESSATQGSNVSITNTLNQTGTFKTYTILKYSGAAITNVEVVFKKV